MAYKTILVAACIATYPARTSGSISRGITIPVLMRH